MTSSILSDDIVRACKERLKRSTLIVLTIALSTIVIVTRSRTPLFSNSGMNSSYSNKDAREDAIKHLPVKMRKVTLAITNHARAENVRLIVEKAVRYGIVDEIIVWDDPINHDNRVNFNHSKVFVIRASELKPMEKWGLLGRFKFALLARNENILIQDDDQLLYESAIIKMLQMKNEDPDRLVCYFGREVVDIKANNQITYLTQKPPAPSHIPICLTKSVLTDRRFCLEAVRYSSIIEDLAVKGVPYWNGEDIWHSLVSIKTTKKLHTEIPIDYKEYKLFKSNDGISDNDKFNHTSFRRMFTRNAAKRLGLDANILLSKQLEPSMMFLATEYKRFAWLGP